MISFYFIEGLVGVVYVREETDDLNHRFFYLFSYSFKMISLGQTVIT